MAPLCATSASKAVWLGDTWPGQLLGWGFETSAAGVGQSVLGVPVALKVRPWLLPGPASHTLLALTRATI